MVFVTVPVDVEIVVLESGSVVGVDRTGVVVVVINPVVSEVEVDTVGVSENVGV